MISLHKFQIGPSASQLGDAFTKLVVLAVQSLSMSNLDTLTYRLYLPSKAMFANRPVYHTRAAALRQWRPVDCCQKNMSVHLVTVFEMYSSSSSVAAAAAVASVASASFAAVVASAFVVVVAFAFVAVVAFAFAAFASVRQWKTSTCDNWRAQARRRDIATSYRIVF